MYQNNFDRKRYSYRTNNDDNENRSNQSQSRSSSQGSRNYHTKPHYQAKKGPKPKQPIVKKFLIAGKDIAIDFICEHTKRHAVSTINMDVANYSDKSEADEYDWNNKMSIQIPRVELPLLTSILIGDIVHARFKQKSIYGDRSYAFLHKDDKLTIHFFEKNKEERSIVLSPNDAYHVTELFLHQLRKNSPWMTTGEIVALIKHTVVSLRQNPDQLEDLDIEFPNDGSEDSFSFSFNEEYIEDESLDFADLD